MSTFPHQRPYIGVGVVVVRPYQKIFVGVRKGSHGATKLALPGGHLEFAETWVDCAAREVKEEMGIALRDLQFLHATNDIMGTENKHYVTIFMAARTSDPNMAPKNLEPHKCEGWEAKDLDELCDMVGKDKLFLPLENLLKERPPSLEQYMKRDKANETS